ncbi:MFS transporter [Bradyrhizobium septentrionale]|uniref:MFS transporter n=1 Tax=Bradyrhizobium septentrionale TaxID=1404411 RepID=UPI001596B0A0|nr:MFS transporter [Bradyrhizobium septentrionale]UGY24893.1 MFS transporter [Bradyrhizobium septentrionale]
MKKDSSVNNVATLGVLSWLMLCSLGTLQLQPQIGGVLVADLGISWPDVGILFGTEFVAAGIGSCVAALSMNRLDRRLLCLCTVLLLLAASIASALVTAFIWLAVARFTAGLAGGVIQAVVYATAALRSNKDRTFATINIVLMLGGALTMGLEPMMTDAGGVAAVFGLFAVMALVVLPLLRVIPRGPADIRDLPLAAANANPAGLGKHAILLLLLFALVFGGHTSLWSYQERIGNDLGLSDHNIGMILGVSTLLGALGAAIAGFVGSRLNQWMAQLIAFTGAITASLLTVYGQSGLAYASGIALLMTVRFFGLTYMFVLSTDLDPSGRLTGLANTAIFVGAGLGPFAAAAVVGDGNFQAVGLLSAGIYVACIAVARYITARSRALRVVPSQ